MERVGRPTWTAKPRGQRRESRETNEFNLLLFLSRKYLEMSSRGRGTRHDKGLVLSLVTRHFSLLPDGAAVDLGHHCRVVARGLVLARAALSTRRRVFFALVDSTFTTCGQDSADHDH